MSQQNDSGYDALDEVEPANQYSEVMVTLYESPRPLEEDELATVVDDLPETAAKTTSYEEDTVEGALDTAVHNRHVEELSGVRSDGETFTKYMLTERGEDVVEMQLQREGVDPDEYRKEALQAEASGFGDLAPELGPDIGAEAQQALEDEYGFTPQETAPTFES